jgi:hypothetical protein
LIIALIPFWWDASGHIPSQDYAIVVEKRNGEVIYRYGGTEFPSSEIVSEMRDDLDVLSVSEFQTKWDISI